MSGLLQFIRLLSALGLFTAAFWVLVPKGKGENTARFAVGVFFLWSVVVGGQAAFSGLQGAFAGRATQGVPSSAPAPQTAALQNGFEMLLQGAGYPMEKVTVEADILKDNSINITKVVLWPKKNEDYTAAARLLVLQAGVPTDAVQQGENDGTAVE